MLLFACSGNELQLTNELLMVKEDLFKFSDELVFSSVQIQFLSLHVFWSCHTDNIYRDALLLKNYKI